ncbi:hypothetical protein RYX36_026109 [Vicia faba]
MTTTDQSTEPGATVSSPASDTVVAPDLFPAGMASRVLHDVAVPLGLLLLMELSLIFRWLLGLVRVGRFLEIGMGIGLLM